ncbi:peptidylprolyl isomerase [[Haemophilus] felis]|uniref:Peptidylprolyl isomerase n=1 Tax=[Haemophilus] felis TaxID=123822 RepID=A0A1T0B7Q2_9PAST|nr:peptidylprolyl isomerase [[Haemophilus] felis]NBI40801.1 peptidylprolyl isomerase [[Haemophilus] felis]OOS06155.1 peptidylprolyl isomerase [[Haemophilus] felis]
MKMIKVKALFLAIAGLIAVTTSAQAAERVIATVNGVPVLQSQVSKFTGKKINAKAALDKVIDDILVQQAIQNSGIKVSNAQLDNIIQGIAAQNGLTYGQFLDALDYQGINYANYRKQLENQIVVNELRNQVIGQSVQVTPEQINELSKQLLADADMKGKTQKFVGKEYEIRHILLKLNPLLNDAQAKAQLDAIRADILANKMSFADAALKYSKDYLSGANGGSLGFAVLDIYSPHFQNAVQNTPMGKISAPFKTEFGWHILEVVNSRDLDRTEDLYRQKAYEQLVGEKLEDVENDWVKVLRQNADIRYIN